MPHEVKVQDWKRQMKEEYDSLFTSLSAAEARAKREELRTWLVSQHGNEDKEKCGKGLRASLIVRTCKDLAEQVRFISPVANIFY
jgi:hypothetical protein